MIFTIEIASVPDRDDLVAEIWDGSEMVAEVHRSSTSSKFEVEIYNNLHSNSWSFDI